MKQERYIEQEDVLDIREVLFILKKRLVLILTLPMIFAAIATGISFFVLRPVYQASVSIIISKDQGSVLTPGDVTMYQDLVQTYTKIAKSDVVAERAISSGNLETTIGNIQAGLTVSSQEGTQVIDMSVKGGEPSDCAKKVEALAEAFLVESKILLPSGSINIMDHAKVPQAPISPNKKLNIIEGFAIGLLIAIAIAFLVEFMDDTIKLEENVEKYFGVPILGVIPKHM